MKSKKDLNYYLSLPWTYTIETETHKCKVYYIIWVNELPGICTDNVSLDEGMKDIKEVIALAIEMYQEEGKEVPEPIDPNKFKGNIAYRTDSRRHYRIARIAKRKHKSISKTIDELLDTALLNFKE